MVYEELTPLTREEGEPLLAHALPPGERSALLLRLSLAPDESAWKQRLFVATLRGPDEALHVAAALALGHLARVSGQVAREEVVAVLLPFVGRPGVGAVAENTLDDIRVFCPE
ncbi:hypothetical protein [Deinococcus sp. Leaf326]|uniref:hypothetical protein n=1 Tax=Deinococcus sp. Leaf326 TaxID=1736338 RepID=UPI0006FE2398|nr:hypothetical protein [Deinococcus sp. Leaf326]KQR08760.1 hypothetical protein ASF71_09565 [Deinococcus sp. Leaf326]